MNRKYPVAALALTAAAWPAMASAAGPWTTSNPGGVTWTAPNDCTLQLDLTTWDGYPARVDMTQAYELVVAYRNGVEIGRTVDLEDRVAQASRSARITTPVAAGDVVTVRHSSLAGLVDGTQNSVSVSASFTCPPPAPTTTVAPATTVAPPTTVPPTSTSSSAPAPEAVAPPSSEATTTTVVATGVPPTPPAPLVPASPPVVSTPRQAPTTAVALPETGSEARTIAHAAAITLGAGVLLVLRMSRRAVR